MTVVARANPPRRRSARRARPVYARARRYRKNPPRQFAGINFTDILYSGVAVISVPFVEKQLLPLLPVSLAASRAGRWAVKVGSAAAIWQGSKYLFGKRTGDVIAVVLGSNLLADAADEFMPSLTGSLSAYTRPTGLNAYTRPRGMGRVTPGPVVRPFTGLPAGGAGRMSVGVNDRLDAKF